MGLLNGPFQHSYKKRPLMLITPERLLLLNQGVTETKNLMEGLAIDIPSLLALALPDTPLLVYQPGEGIIKRMQQAAQHVIAHAHPTSYAPLAKHQSDTLRGIACYIIAHTTTTLPESLTQMQPFADDMHFGVREWAWLALRPHVAHNPLQALTLLQPWVHHPSERIRRFAVEITRPRGVWCSHIQLLKEQPELARTLLEPLKNDPARYVQLSVGNWLNDASKSNAAWVQALCNHWLSKSTDKAVITICKRAQRSLQRKKRATGNHR